MQPVTYTYRTNDRGDYSTYQDGVHRVFDNLISTAADDDGYSSHPSVLTHHYHTVTNVPSSTPFAHDYRPKLSTGPKSSKARKKYDYVPLVSYIRPSHRPIQSPTPTPETGTGAISHINFSNEAWLKNRQHIESLLANQSHVSDPDEFQEFERDDGDDELGNVNEDFEEPDGQSPGNRRYEEIERRKNVKNVKTSTESTVVGNGGVGHDQPGGEVERVVNDTEDGADGPINAGKGNSNRKYEKETIKYTEERSTLTTDRPLADVKDDGELESEVDSGSHFDDEFIADRLDTVETPVADEEIEEDDDEEQQQEEYEGEPLQIEQEDDTDESIDESNAKSLKILSKPLRYSYTSEEKSSIERNPEKSK